MNDNETRIELSDGHISVVVDQSEVEEIGTVVLAPAYGLTADDMFLPACFLARNGLRVIRFDMRNHVGASSGRIYDFRLSGVYEDLRALMEWAGPAGLMAISLSGRPAIRLAADADLAWLLLVIPVVDVEYTLETVTELPVFKGYRAGDFQSLEVLGFEVSCQFLSDSEEIGFVTRNDAIRDFERVTAPSVVLYGRGDPWVRASDVTRMAEARRRRNRDQVLEQIPTTCHQINQNPVIANRFMAAATRHAVALAGGDPDAVTIPTFAEVIESHQALLDQRRRSDTTEPAGTAAGG